MRKKFLTAVLTALLCTSFITNIAGAATSGVIYPKKKSWMVRLRSRKSSTRSTPIWRRKRKRSPTKKLW